jgi:hypothetical protein
MKKGRKMMAVRMGNGINIHIIVSYLWKVAIRAGHGHKKWGKETETKYLRAPRLSRNTRERENIGKIRLIPVDLMSKIGGSGRSGCTHHESET